MAYLSHAEKIWNWRVVLLATDASRPSNQRKVLLPQPPLYNSQRKSAKPKIFNFCGSYASFLPSQQCCVAQPGSGQVRLLQPDE